MLKIPSFTQSLRQVNTPDGDILPESVNEANARKAAEDAQQKQQADINMLLSMFK